IEPNGRAGIEFNYQVSAGSYAATIEFDASVHVPITAKVGETVKIGGSPQFKDGTIDPQSPTAPASCAVSCTEVPRN
ncbi:MAG: hypothetical protein AAFO17_15765, partial [Pseudomonadota bacterium]